MNLSSHTSYGLNLRLYSLMLVGNQIEKENSDFKIVKKATKTTLSKVVMTDNKEKEFVSCDINSGWTGHLKIKNKYQH